MAQIQTFQREWEGRNATQTQPNEKHKQFYGTQSNQKAIEWLETQTHQKEWELHEKRGESRQRAKNGEPIVVINHLNSSEHDIVTMVEQVLTKNEFSDDSSIFVVVPSIDNDAGNSSNHQNSNVCMQMCEKPVALKKKDNPAGRDPKQHRNSTTHQGVKLSSKGKMFFMEGLPADMLPFHNREVLFDRQTPMPKDDWKKETKNKLCQISTPNRIVERVENRCNVVSVDTTVDRPCCCSVKTNQFSDYNSNDRQVANVMSNVMTPLLDKKGVIGTPFYKRWCMNPQESFRSENLPLAPCNIPQCRLHRSQHHIAVPPQQFTRNPIQQLTCTPTQQYARAFSQQHTRAPIQQLACAPTHLTWAHDQQYAEACPTQNRGEACPTQRRAEACPTQNRGEACPTQHRAEPYPTQNRGEAFPTQRRAEAFSTQQDTEARSTQQHAEPCPIQHPACPTCQCTPEQLLELFKLAVTGGKLYGIPTICGECPEPDTLAPPAEPASGDPCLCEEPRITKLAINEPTCPCDSTTDRMLIEMGATKQKRGSIRQTRFSATVGTSTDAKPSRKSGWWSWRKNICECPIAEPEAEPELKPKPKESTKLVQDYDPEPHLTLESYFQHKDSLILSSEVLKKNSLETERVSGFRLKQDKKQPPEPESDFTAEDAIRYLAMMNPDLFHHIMTEQQAKLDGTYEPPPPPPPEVEPTAPPPDAKADEGPFKGLKFKIGGKGSGSKGLAGVCCFDLLTESFTTW